MTEIYGPADVTAGVIGFLRRQGIRASSKVPATRENGMVRVTRVGGQPRSFYEDEALILVEVWDQSHEASFDLARRIWGLVAQVSVDDQEAFPGLVVYKAVPDMPLQDPDEFAPDMDRHQLTINMHVRMEPMGVPDGTSETSSS